MLVTKEAPDIKAVAVMGNNSIKNVTLKDLMGKNGLVLFFYPKDFTFVCPTEIITFNNKLEEFESRGYNVVGVSCDSEMVHIAWKNTDINNGGIGNIKYPLIADIKKEVARSYDVLFDDSVSLRGTFVIDKSRVIRHATINDLPLGRNIDEMIRIIDAIEFVNKYGEVCPANWKKGQDGMKPTTEGVKEYLSKNLK